MVLGFGAGVAVAAGAVLIAAVFAAVDHAEVVAHRIGEPFGTLVLALVLVAGVVWASRRAIYHRGA